MIFIMFPFLQIWYHQQYVLFTPYITCLFTANPAPRTISLPYGTTQVSAISKPAGHALPVASITGVPVARVCPQPLNIPSASTIASPNLVTITSSTSTALSVSSTDNIITTPSSVQVQGIPTTGSVYIARPTQAHAVVPQISIGSGNRLFCKIATIRSWKFFMPVTEN